MVSGTAIDGKNYRVMTPSPLFIRAGETTGAITLALMDDKLYEDNKVIFVSIGAPVNATLGAHPVHRLTVVESDPPPVVDFQSKDAPGEEGQGPEKINVVLSTVSGRRTTIEYAIAGGIAAQTKDHTRTRGMLVFEPGETVKTIDIGSIDDTLNQDNESIEVTLSNPVNAILGNTRVHTRTVPGQTDIASKPTASEEPAPTVSFVASGSAGYEKKGLAKIPVSLSAAGSRKVTLAYAVTGGTAVNGRNFVLKNGTLAFKPGETSKSIDMRIIDDRIYNDNKTIEVTLSNPVNAVLGKQTVHTYTIVENDPPPSVTFASPAQDVREADGEITISVKLSPVSGKDVIVPFMVSGTAIDGKNYRVMTPSPLFIKAGETTGAITLSLMDDKLYEDNKVIFVSIGAPVNATLGAHPVHRVTVVESDPPPVVAFALKDSSGDEGKSPAKIEVSLSGASGKRASVEYAITGGTAENNKDYTLTNGTLVFEPGETVKTIDIGIIDDKLHEDNETIEVTLSNPVNAVPGKQTVHTYTIIDNDPEPTVTFTAPGQEVKEDMGKVTASLKLSAASGKDVTVPFTLSGTAIDGKNYRVMTPNPLTIRAGETTGAITLALMDNKLYEDNKTIIVTMEAPVNATAGAQTQQTETIVENDPPPAVDFLFQESQGDEGKSPAKIEVSLSEASGKTGQRGIRDHGRHGREQQGLYPQERHARLRTRGAVQDHRHRDRR